MVGWFDCGLVMFCFSGFYGKMADDNWVPDEGYVLILKMILQFMLVVVDSVMGWIFLFLSWLREWDVDFKLYAEGAVIEAVCESGVLIKLVVMLFKRCADIVFVQQDYYCL